MYVLAKQIYVSGEYELFPFGPELVSQEGVVNFVLSVVPEKEHYQILVTEFDNDEYINNQNFDEFLEDYNKIL